MSKETIQRLMLEEVGTCTHTHCRTFAAALRALRLHESVQRSRPPLIVLGPLSPLADRWHSPTRPDLAPEVGA